MSSPLVAVVMGSKSDWPTMEHACNMLAVFGIEHETSIVSAHRTPDRLFDFAQSAADRGIRSHRCRDRRPPGLPVATTAC